uniref:Gustatory receptor n=1 Tax=Graphocephala atropunctata TaxID=36148 RepID=A0A1B6LX89_9HEMI
MKVPSDERCQTQAFPTEILWFSQLFGGFPLTYSSDKNGNKRLRFSLTVFMWGLVVVIMETVLLIVWLGTIYSEAFWGQHVERISNTTLMVVTLDVCSMTVMIAVVFITYVRKYQSIITASELIETVDRNLQHKINDFWTKIRVFSILVLVVTVLAYSGITERKRPLYAEIQFLGLSKSMVSHIPVINVSCTQAAVFVHFTYITNSIAKRFKVNNTRIKQEVARMSSMGKSVTCEEKKKSNCELEVLIDNYWMLCNAVHKANNFYSAQLLVTILSMFFHITIDVYYFIVHITNGDIVFITTDGAWVLLHVCHLILLICPTSEVIDSADETAPIVCKLINKSPDPALRRQLETFLLQLPNHKARFSALGFFDLKTDILTSMAGVVTTYVVILLEFQPKNETI